MKIDGHAVGEDAAAVERNSEQLAHLAVGAVGTDQVFRADVALRAAVGIAHRRGDAIAILLEADQFEAIPNRSANLLRMLAQNALEPRLINKHASDRGERIVDADIEARNDVGKLAPGQTVHGDDGAFRNEILFRLGADFVLDADRAKQFDGTKMEVTGAR